MIAVEGAVAAILHFTTHETTSCSEQQDRAQKTILTLTATKRQAKTLANVNETRTDNVVIIDILVYYIYIFVIYLQRGRKLLLSIRSSLPFVDDIPFDA